VITNERAVDIGRASLTGARGRIARSIAEPISRRSGLTREQVEAILGFLLIIYALYSVIRPVVRAARQDR
jgi:hypothetical protein